MASTFWSESILHFLQSHMSQLLIPLQSWEGPGRWASLRLSGWAWAAHCTLPTHRHTHSENHNMADESHTGSFVPARNHLFSYFFWIMVREAVVKISQLVLMGLKMTQISALYATLFLVNHWLRWQEINAHFRLYNVKGVKKRWIKLFRAAWSLQLWGTHTQYRWHS